MFWQVRQEVRLHNQKQMNLHAKRLGQDHDWGSSEKQFNKLRRVGGIEDGTGWGGMGAKDWHVHVHL